MIRNLVYCDPIHPLYAGMVDDKKLGDEEEEDLYGTANVEEDQAIIGHDR